ncbi:MAG: GNAT family N-acetyltransferase [Candidatus Heimdallarchaeota archaeon]|nr:MAG: GNAT family N-acetyltransferase [Candidatus Heimdallarchaeota archaeon]
MEMRQLTSEDREAFARLERYAFEPARNTYEGVVKEDYEETQPHLKDMSQVYGCFDKGTLVSSFAYFTSIVVIRNKEFPMSGIWGVATAPHYRNRGLIRQLTQLTLEKMYNNKIQISCLYPFKFSFYQKFGWKLANINHRYHIETNKFIFRPISDRVVREVFELDDLKEVYSNIAGKKYNYMGKRTEEDWRRKVNPKEPGYLFVCYDDKDNPCGYLIARFLEHQPPQDEGVENSAATIYLQEIFWYDRKTKQALFNFLKRHEDHRKYVVFSTTDPNILESLIEARVKANEVFPGSMTRIVDVKSVIEAFGYLKDIKFVIKVNDQLCEWNNKAFTFIVSEGKANLEETSQSPDVTIDIGSLSQMIVGFRTASQLYDSWEIDCSEEMLPILNQLFPPQTNFYREFF